MAGELREAPGRGARGRVRRIVTLPAHMQALGPLGRRSRGVLAALGAFWLAADAGYYLLLPRLGVANDYNAAPVAIAVYYLFWCGLAVIAFWPVYALWAQHAPWPALGNRLAAVALWTGMFGAAAGYAGWVVPALPPLVWPADFGPVPDVAAAGAAYFLPKTADIAFQQLLVLALVLALAANGVRAQALSLACAGLFGGMHLLLLLGEYPFGAAVRFIVFAAGFGALVPVLLLRVPFGLALSFGLHWLYYAVTVTQVRIWGPEVVLRLIGAD
ncbi:MAG: hypothetical protein IT545_06215 [Rhodobacteraceae bacterium]|nr:hypothetical protein [Paracoccaceae bacterium]